MLASAFVLSRPVKCKLAPLPSVPAFHGWLCCLSAPLLPVYTLAFPSGSISHILFHKQQQAKLLGGQIMFLTHFYTAMSLFHSPDHHSQFAPAFMSPSRSSSPRQNLVENRGTRGQSLHFQESPLLSSAPKMVSSYY